MSEETKTAPIGAPEVSEQSEPAFEPGHVATPPQKADLTDPDTAKAFMTPEREMEEEDDGSLDVDDGGWEGLREVKEPRAKAPATAAATAEPEDMPATEEEIAAILAAPTGRKVIKNPYARARILEKERDVAEERLKEKEAKLDRLLAAFEGKAPAAPADDAREEDLSPAEKILREQQKLHEEVMEIRKERTMEKQMAVAEQQLRSVSQAIQVRSQDDPVFVDAMNHVARVMARRVQRDPAFGKTEAEKQRNFMQLVLSEHLKIAESGDPSAVVAWTYDKAEDFGFDIAASCRKHGVLFEGMNEKEVFPDGPPKAAAPATTRAPQKVDPRAEIAASRRRNEGTASVAGLTGKPPKRFSAKNMLGKSTNEFAYEAKRAAAAGEIGSDPRSGRPTYDDLMREVAENR